MPNEARVKGHSWDLSAIIYGSKSEEIKAQQTDMKQVTAKHTAVQYSTDGVYTAETVRGDE